MAGYDPKKAETFNKLRQAGLTEDQAADQAGITGADADFYAVNDVPGDPNRGTMGPLIIGAGKRAGVDYDKLTAAELKESTQWDEGPKKVTYPVKADSAPSTRTQETVTTTSTETISGGGSTTTVVQPTQFRDTPASIAAQSRASDLQAQKDQLAAELKAEGKTGGQVLRDPRYRELSQQQQAAQTEADNAKEAVPGTGGITVTTTPNSNSTTTTVTTGSPSYLTQNAGDADPSVQIQQVSQTPTSVAANQVQTQPQAQVTEITIGAPIEPPAVTGETIVTSIPPAAVTPPQIETSAPAAQPGALVGLDPVEAEIALQQSPQPVFTESEVIPGFTADPRAAGENVGSVLEQPAAVPPSQTGYLPTRDDDGNLLPGYTATDDGDVFIGPNFVDPSLAVSAEASRVAAGLSNARNQMALSNSQSLPITSADWRVRLSLARNANYLYRSAAPGILSPLARTNGVIFPYTPTIETNYVARYDPVDLTHSNYRGYFYKNSAVENVNIRCTFTAQDTREAEYLLAVIHFFRSVTKMFYGAGDQLAGTPPPLVFLSGLGQYQFNNQPCVVSNFQYVLPADVDYIRAKGFNNYGINLENRRQQGSGPAPGGVLGAIGQIQRLANNGLISRLLGRSRPGSGFQSNVSRSNFTNSTYVPTKIDIVVTLLPIQTRSQVSTQFNMQQFANGDLLKGGGFW